MNEAGAYILSHTPNSFQKMYEGNYSNGFETDVDTLKLNGRNHRKVSVNVLYLGDSGSCPEQWTNPLEVQYVNAREAGGYALIASYQTSERPFHADTLSIWARKADRGA